MATFEDVDKAVEKLTASALKVKEERDLLLAFVIDIHEELDNRYDGAEDSRSRWIGAWLEKARGVIDKVVWK